MINNKRITYLRNTNTRLSPYFIILFNHIYVFVLTLNGVKSPQLRHTQNPTNAADPAMNNHGVDRDEVFSV